MERTEGAMNRPPVSADEIFSKRSLFDMAFFGLVQTAIVVGLFVYGVSFWGNGAASTAAFFTLSMTELFHAFNVRKERGCITLKEFFKNKALLVTVAVGVFVNVLLAAVPFLSYAFDLTPLTAGQWCAVFGLSLAIIPIAEIYKIARRIAERRETGGRKVSRRKTRSPARGSTR